MVFKGKYNSYKQNKLNKIDLVANMNIYVVCQENPWVTNEIFDYWLDNILFPYRRFINPLTSPGEGVTVLSPYLSAGAPAQGEAKGLIENHLNY